MRSKRNQLTLPPQLSCNESQGSSLESYGLSIGLLRWHPAPPPVLPAVPWPAHFAPRFAALDWDRGCGAFFCLAWIMQYYIVSGLVQPKRHLAAEPAVQEQVAPFESSEQEQTLSSELLLRVHTQGLKD